MSEKNIKSRIVNKHDVETSWDKATGFSPLLGELVIYDADENHDLPRIKIGDGESNVNDLAFIGSDKANVVHTHTLSDIVDAPFDITGGDTLTWDGNTEELESVDNVYYKISDAVPTVSELQTATICTLSSGVEAIEEVYTVSSDAWGLLTGTGMPVICINKDNVVANGIIFAHKGTYFAAADGIYTASITIPDYAGFKTTKLKLECMPNHTHDDDGSGNNIVNTYATKTELNAISDKVGDTPVADQINAAISNLDTSVSEIVYRDSEDHINIERISEDYMNSVLKITGEDIIFTDYAMDEYPILDMIATKTDKGHKHSAADITSGTLSVQRGGTGAANAADARENLGVYSKEEHKWTKIYDSGEITSAVNAFANINISGYNKLMVSVKCVNDGTSSASKNGAITFTSLTQVKYQLPVWSGMFSNSECETACMGWFDITSGWLICSNASRNLNATNFMSNTEGGTADNLAGIGGGMIKCTNTLSTAMISALDQDKNYYFQPGSRVIVWGCNA